MTLPPITNKQREIIDLLYRHRFLDRIQLQKLLHHKDKRRIISWLKDLREKQYIDWIYNSKNFSEKTKPAIYHISTNGIKYLRSLNQYSETELRKRYKDSKRTGSFMDRCLLLADCVVSLPEPSSDGTAYTYITESDYVEPQNPHDQLTEIKPRLVIIKHSDKSKTIYLLEAIDMRLPRYQLRKRLSEYVDFLVSDEYEYQCIVLLVCPDKATLIYCKRRVQLLLEGHGEKDISSRIRFTLAENIRESGVASQIWEAAA